MVLVAGRQAVGVYVWAAMGFSADAFWLHTALAGLFQVLAIVALFRGRPYLGWTLQFGAGHSAFLAALAAERLPLLLLAGLLSVPVVLIPGRRLTGRPRALWSLAACLVGLAVVARFAAVWADPETRGRPMVRDRWTSSSPLRLMGDSLVLKPQWRRGRVCDWGTELRFEWTVPGGSDPFDVHIENAGRAEDWSVEEGTVEVRGGDRSRLRLRLAFPPGGGTCRLRHRPATGPVSLLVVGGLQGDLDALERLLDDVRHDLPDGVVLLGDMIAPGDYAGLLAVRDLVDGLGSRMLYVPGPAERADDNRSGFDVLFRGRALRDRMAVLAGVAAILIDTSSGEVGLDRLVGIGFRRLLGPGVGASGVFTSRALATPAGREAGLMADEPSRKGLLKKLVEWKTGWVASTAPGERFDFSHDGVRHLGIGVRDDAVDAALVTLHAGAVTDVSWLSVTRSPVGDGVTWRRLCAFAEEHPVEGERLAIGCAVLLGGVLSLAGRRRRQEETKT